MNIQKIIMSIATITFKEWFAYRARMITAIFTGPIYFFAQFFVWKSVFSTRETINGFDLNQMLTYYGIIMLINYFTFDYVDWELQAKIHSGDLSVFLLRPSSYKLYAFSQKIGHRCQGFLFEVVPVLLLLILIFKIHLIPIYPVWSIVSIILAFLMSFLVNLFVGSLCFWITKADGIRWVLSIIRDILAGTLIPLTFFPDVVQKILFFLPFQFISYVPTRVYVGTYELAGYSLTIPQIVGIQFLSVIFMFLLSEVVWHMGIKRFMGTGV